jgi:hypothetical protein
MTHDKVTESVPAPEVTDSGNSGLGTSFIKYQECWIIRRWIKGIVLCFVTLPKSLAVCELMCNF